MYAGRQVDFCTFIMGTMWMIYIQSGIAMSRAVSYSGLGFSIVLLALLSPLRLSVGEWLVARYGQGKAGYSTVRI